MKGERNVVNFTYQTYHDVDNVTMVYPCLLHQMCFKAGKEMLVLRHSPVMKTFKY